MVSTGQRTSIKRDFQRALLNWVRPNLRKYPWREKGTSTYKVLIAELLLKRTTATAAARIYDIFIKKYPTIHQLANADTNDLISLLQPIGLSNQRAHVIKELAHFLVQYHEGQVPCIFEQLRSLPGIGNYASRAILSFGHGFPVAVVDGNVERVFGRVFQDQWGDNPNRNSIQEKADGLIPSKEHRLFNFALLDLGALICRPAQPSCNKCPLLSICDRARSHEDPTQQKGLQVLRKTRQFSQLALARNAQVSKMTIINIEAGRTVPRVETLRKIAKALNVPSRELKDVVISKTTEGENRKLFS